MIHTKKFLRHQRITPEPVPAIASLTADREIEQDLENLLRSFTSLDAVRLQGELQERAAIIGWRGSPMAMPARICLAAARKIKGVET